MKSLVGKILRKLLPFKYYKWVANGFIIVPSYYKTIIKDAETYMDLSLKDSPEKDILLMRKYAHILYTEVMLKLDIVKIYTKC